MVVGPKLAAERPVALELRIYCTACNAPIHLLGPVRSIACAACGRSVSSPRRCGRRSCPTPTSTASIAGAAIPPSRRGVESQPGDSFWLAGNPSPRRVADAITLWRSALPAAKRRSCVGSVGAGSRRGRCRASCGSRSDPRCSSTAQLSKRARRWAVQIRWVAPRCGGECNLPPDASPSTRCTSCDSIVSVPELLAQSPLCLDRVWWCTFQGAPPRVGERIARQTLDVRPHSRDGPSLLRDAVDHTIGRVEKDKQTRQKAYAIVVLAIVLLFGVLAYWRYFTQRGGDGDDFTFDPRSSD